MRFLLTGGRSRSRGEDPDHQCDAGMVIELDTDERDAEIRMVYESPAEVRPADDSSIVFKAGHVDDGQLYLCTTTEVLVTPLNDLGHIDRYVSHRWFNDLHHVRPIGPKHRLVVVSTGLDAAFELDEDGEVTRSWPVIDDDVWTRFDPECDYRHVLSTKPHRAHPNHLLEVDGSPCVNRCHQRDVVCLDDGRMIIDYSDLGAVGHDGVHVGNTIFLTSVNGRVAVVDGTSSQRLVTFDLDDATRSARPLGWCRGIAPVDDRHWLVGFSRMRPTLWKENVSWVKSRLRGSGGPKAPTRVACYDPVDRMLRWELNLETFGMAEIFSILPLDADPDRRTVSAEI